MFIYKLKIKQSIYKNLKQYKIGKGNNSELVLNVMKTRKNWSQQQQAGQECKFIWQSVSSQIKFQQINNTFVNHFEFHKQITTKNNLIKNLESFAKFNSLYIYDITPLTYCINPESSQFQQVFEEFLNLYQSKSTFPFSQKHESSQKIGYCQPKYPQSLFSGKNVWIIKPADFNRGCGIKLFSSLKQLINILLADNKKYLERQFIIQKYIEQPLLINERKFDLRIWVMLTDIRKKEDRNNFQLYIFKEGYIRTSSEKFDISSEKLNDLIIHLTNNAIQKTDQRYQKFEQGNQLSYDQLDQNLKINFRQNIMPKIKEIISFTIDSVKNKINFNNRINSFEIFGYDFVIDKYFNPWLIEINTNPCIEESSSLLKQLIPRMLDDAFKIAIDPYFCGKKLEDGKQYFKVKKYKDDENMWYFFINYYFFIKKIKIKRELQQNLITYPLLKYKKQNNF
ncbi:tubulin-tyrosine ligase family protein, putative [Ichthyophthirius multifiliis]|uniref:Tubulin-tyrosine ligase family protein, putative n=1 Tax=Ichthyophthirius multifiliis TaxID=5932 RepID=G0QTK2_ICHMU|nr:tubulin-tyrosine ligase family protein, putative [Ichthyophthirius multifiliis]EGR31453.1 tubulin-tyrosine ligase family protein, putative [Ichthyophthirius multifiliis]|eukprot:XP_004034939.1 tubulin-tyrosine ligase family protein, putative [Ichthyophthirius multifiliis]